MVPTAPGEVVDGPVTNAALPGAARFIAGWNFPLLSRLPARVFLILLVLGLCFVRAYIGLWGVREYVHDAFSALDGAWRVMNGQRPHLDFYTALGPVSYLVTAGGLVLSGGNANGLACGQALFGAMVGIWTYCLASRRLPQVPASILCVLVVLISIAPTVVGAPANVITPGMTYNRYGYALFSLLLVEAVRPNREKRARGEFWGGLSTGAVLGLSLFLKISFFLGAAFMLAALLPLRPQHRERWRGIIAGCGVTSLAFLSYLRFDIAAVLRDLTIAAHSKHFSYGGYLIYDVLFCALPFLICMGVLSRSSNSTSSGRAILLAAASICLTGFFLLMTSWQFRSLPLNAVMSILLIDRMVQEASRNITMQSLRRSALLVLTLLIFSYASSDALALEFAASQKLGRKSEQFASFSAPALSGFTTVQRDYVDLVNDGFVLLNRHRSPKDTILTLDFTNPFSYSLGAAPAWGGSTWLQYTNNFGEAGPSAERLFGNASLVMVPKKFTDPTLIDSIPRLYGPFLRQHFRLVAESANWRLYHRS